MTSRSSRFRCMTPRLTGGNWQIIIIIYEDEIWEDTTPKWKRRGQKSQFATRESADIPLSLFLAENYYDESRKLQWTSVIIHTPKKWTRYNASSPAECQYVNNIFVVAVEEKNVLGTYHKTRRYKNGRERNPPNDQYKHRPLKKGNTTTHNRVNMNIWKEVVK